MVLGSLVPEPHASHHPDHSLPLTWIRSTTWTTSRSAFPKSPMAVRDVQKGRTYLGCGPFFASSVPHAATLLLHSAFLFLYTHSVRRMLLPLSRRFGCFALSWVVFGRPFILLQSQMPGQKKNNCCFFCFLHDQNAFFLTAFNQISPHLFSSRHIMAPRYMGPKRATQKGVLRVRGYWGQKAQVFFACFSSSLT